MTTNVQTVSKKVTLITALVSIAISCAIACTYPLQSEKAKQYTCGPNALCRQNVSYEKKQNWFGLTKVISGELQVGVGGSKYKDTVSEESIQDLAIVSVVSGMISGLILFFVVIPRIRRR